MQGCCRFVIGVSPVGFGGVQKVTEATYRRFHIVTRDHGVQFRDGAIRVLQDLNSAIALFIALSKRNSAITNSISDFRAFRLSSQKDFLNAR